jgi:malonyl CoA-acyl carrier protein transacylase
VEPIAIIGVGCRFPGANNPESFWRLLHDGVDAITKVPSNRWNVDAFYDPNPVTPGKMNTRWGGFLEQVDQFDSGFFGISPREAERMDPQQRLVLEVAWEALEDAGLAPELLAGSQTGVFIGIGNYDYGRLLCSDLSNIDSHNGTGLTLSLAANRLSYLLNLHGPSMAIETACSSSLVAIHSGCQSLRSGESNLVIVGGVSLILSPDMTITFSQARMMAADGRCKTFDASADGYVRGEGCGIVILKRLEDAIRDRDRILALIRGSAVNHDGLSNGITAPNGLAQQAVIRQALENAGVAPAQISYVEAHGTGTSLGDPIEIRALKAVLTQGRLPEQCCGIGSVKTNIGHLEPAAGIAGLIKVVLSLQYGEIFPHLHLNQLNPYLSLDETPFFIPKERQSWTAGIKRRFAGVSGFSFGGTNCHVILEEAPASAVIPTKAERPLELLTLSAKNEKALQELAQRYEIFLASHRSASVADVCFTANTGRSHFTHRLAIIFKSTLQLRDSLSFFREGRETSGLLCSKVSNRKHLKIAFLFTGQGSQYVDMGRQLYQTQPAFRQTLEHCDEILRPYLKKPLLEILYPDIWSSKPKSKIQNPELDETAYTQPALFSLEYALAELWKSWGITPHVVMGHSLGEYIAACVAGVFSLKDGLKLIATRARLMQQLPGGGTMVAIMAAYEQVQPLLVPYINRVAIAAINGPMNVVLSGEGSAVYAVVAQLKAQGVKCTPLTVSHAFHSPLMQPMLAEFERVAATIHYSPARVPLISNVNGLPVADEVTTPQYWVRHLRQPVQFAASMQTLQQQGYEVFVEMGPKPVLLGMGQQCLPETGLLWLPSLHPSKEDWQQMLESLAQLYVRGVEVDWAGFECEYPRCKVALPTYPFQRQRYWIKTSEAHQKVGVVALETKTTPVMDLLHQGDNHKLTQQLEKSGKFSPEQVKILPKLLDELAQQHQQQLAVSTIKDWLYQVQWKSSPPKQQKPTSQPSHWLIFAASTGIGEAVATRLQQQGHQCTLVYRADTYQNLRPGIYQLNPSHPQEFAQLYQEIVNTSQLPLQKVIHLWSLDALPSHQLTNSAIEQAQMWGCGSVLHIVQALVKNKNSTSPQLWLVTQGAQPVLLQEELAIAQAPLWGLGRVISLEHPQLWGGLVDLDPQAPEDEVSMLLQQIEDNQEDHLAFRDGQTYVARLCKQSLTASQPLSLHPEGSYLITGGLGALGLHTAQWMVEQGARHLVLTSRRQPSETAQQMIEQLEKAGAQILVLSADISTEQDVTTILQRIEPSPWPLKGIVHAAGVLDDDMLQQMNWERFTKVMAPKVAGTWHLHKFTKHLPLDFFVCFSSAASLLGSAGQGNYAAANAFMDALAHHRRGIGLPGLSINWGAWVQGGMAARLASHQQHRMETAGFRLISTKQGLQVLEQLLGQSTGQVGVLPVDWLQLAEQLSLAKPSSLLSEFFKKEELQHQLSTKRKKDGQILEKLKAAPKTERQDILRVYLQSRIAKVLRLNSSEIPTDANLIEFGIDSLMAMEILNYLSRDTELMIYPKEFYERPRIDSLAQYLSDELEINYDSPNQNQPSKILETTKSIPFLPSLTPISDRLPGIIFIFSSPRSGSTLLRVMLAGHQSLFSPPELHLLPFNTMKERRDQLNHSYLGEGLQRALMEINNLDTIASHTLIKNMELQDLSVKQVYQMLQESILPRLLVDKSPTYAMDLNTLRQAEVLFSEAKYIHLVRHPYSVIDSFVRARMYKVVELDNANPYQVAEQVWTQTNQNILNFFEEISFERHYQIRYEELVNAPTRVMTDLCNFLNIPFQLELLQPYQGERMTDGVHSASIQIGDPNFFKHKIVDPSLGENWKTIELPHQLGENTRRIASQLNYDLPTTVDTPLSSNAVERNPELKQRKVFSEAIDYCRSSEADLTKKICINEQYLEFGSHQICLCTWGPENGPLILCIHGILEQGAVWEEVARPLAEKGYRVVAPDLFGHGRSSHLETATSYNSLTFLAQINHVVQRLPDQPLFLVGHSMGTMLAAMMASVQPQKVKGLVLVEPILPTKEKRKELINQLTTCLEYFACPPQHPTFLDLAAARERLRQATPNLSEELSLILAQRITVPCDEGVRWNWDPILRTRAFLDVNGFMRDRATYLEILKHIQVPTTLVYGDSSNLNRPEDLQQQQEAMAQAKRVFLLGGHNLHLEAAPTLVSLIKEVIENG